MTVALLEKKVPLFSPPDFKPFPETLEKILLLHITDSVCLSVTNNK